MRGSLRGVACLGPRGGKATAAGPTNALAGMPVARGFAAHCAVRRGAPLAGGRLPIQAVQDVSCSAGTPPAGCPFSLPERTWCCSCRRHGLAGYARQHAYGYGERHASSWPIFPAPPDGGGALLSYARQAATAGGRAGGPLAQQLGWGISRCCCVGHEGHRAPGQAPPQQRRAQAPALEARRRGGGRALRVARVD